MAMVIIFLGKRTGSGFIALGAHFNHDLMVVGAYCLPLVVTLSFTAAAKGGKAKENQEHNRYILFHFTPPVIKSYFFFLNLSADHIIMII